MILPTGRLDPRTRDTLRAVASLLAISGLVVVLAILVWELAEVLLLGFGAILVSILLLSLAGLIGTYTPAKGRWSLLAAGLVVAAIVFGFILILGTQVWTQALELLDRLPGILRSLEERFGLSDLDSWVSERLREGLDQGEVVTQVAGYTSLVASGAAHLFLVIVMGIYLALRPDFYRKGFLKLFPPRQQGLAGETLFAVGRALQLWLLGQLAAMTLVGLLTGTGLWLLGIPSALALGVLAGILEFVPFFGPILSAVPAVLLALTLDGTTALWVIGLYVAIQQMEGNLITPLVQQRAVDLPPVITLLSIVAFGVLFGSLGVLLATPLAVVALVAVKKLWIRETLDTPTELPGED